MLTLPQSSSQRKAEVIHMHESAEALADLLSIISGLEISQLLGNFSHLESILYAAEKYEMSMAIAVVRLALFSPFLRAASPIRLYGIACRMRWEREAKHASTRTLTLDLLSPAAMSDLATVETSYRDKLVALHRSRKDMFLMGLDNITKPRVGTRLESVSHCPPCGTVFHYGGVWFAFKYALLKRMEHSPLGETFYFDDRFYQMPEVEELNNGSKCAKCQKVLIDFQEILKQLLSVAPALPKCIEVRTTFRVDTGML